MANAVKQVAIRLKPEGGAEVVAEARKAEEALVGAANRSKTATEAAVAAADRQVAKLREVGAAAAQAAHNTPVQNNIDRITGVSGGGNARADVAARTLYAADEQAARAAAAIRAEIDPLAAATDGYNAELREMAALQARGHLTAQEFARGQELAKNRLDATTAALGRNTSGLTRNQMASRLNLTRQAADVAVTASMGMNPAMIAMQQGPQIADALATSGLRASASMLALGGAIAVAAGSVVALGAAYLQAEGGYLALDRAATGLGRTAGLTADRLQEIAREGADAAEISVSAAEKQAAAFVSTGRIGGEAIRGLIALSKDYAAFTGQDATEATASLAKAMLDPAAAAKQWTRDFGLLDQATIKHIESLQKHGKQAEAHAILIDALSAAVADQATRINDIESAWDGAARGVSNYWSALGRALYTTPDERLEALDRQIVGARSREAQGITLRPGFIKELEDERASLLRAQLDTQRRAAGAADAAENQAAQLAVDGAPRARTDRSAEREARERLMRQRREEDHQAALERNIAELQGDRVRVMALEDEERVRQRIRELVDAGKSQTEAETTADQERTRLVAARMDQMDRLLQQRGRELEVSDAIAAGDHAAAAMAQDRNDAQGIFNDYLEITRNATLAQILADTELAALAEQRADAIARSVAERQREHRLTLAELSGNERLAERLRRDQDIDRRAREIERGGKLDRGQGEARAAEEIAQETHARLVGAGRDWAKGLARDIRESGIKDALADQLESAVDRMINRMIDSLFDFDWGQLFQAQGQGGGGNWLSALASAVFGGPPGKNAQGTDYWKGGPSWVGEEGPELVNLPRGAQVIDADRSRRMAAVGASAGRAAAPVVHNYFSGNLMTPEFWAAIQRGDAQAASTGASRGASMAVQAVHASAGSVEYGDRMMRG